MCARGLTLGVPGHRPRRLLKQYGDHRVGLHLRVPFGISRRRIWRAVRALRRPAAVLLRRWELLAKFYSELCLVPDMPSARHDGRPVSQLRIDRRHHSVPVPTAALPLALPQPLRAVQRVPSQRDDNCRVRPGGGRGRHRLRLQVRSLCSQWKQRICVQMTHI